MISREENTAYIATISGGKDSVTMCDLLLKNGYPVDYIVFSDTLLEFPLMYEYLKKLKKYFKERYNKEIITTEPNKTFEDWCFGKIKGEDAKLKGWVRGIPLKSSGICYWRRESKIYAFERLIKRKGIKKYKTYVGYTLDEKNRLNKEDNTKLFPLVDIFMMREEDCKAYLINQEMENPLYKFFSRTGCFMCPFQSDLTWYQIWRNFPKQWEWCKQIENKLQDMQDKGEKILNKHWFVNHQSIADMEQKFKQKDMQGSLFDFSDEPLKDCFCKI